jgi:hypothetical protein
MRVIVKRYNNVKEIGLGVHSSLVVSLHKINNNNMLGKQITVGQLIE